MMETPEQLRTHYSGLTLHRKCPQAWKYRYMDRLYKPDSELVPARDFGTWWHAVKAAESLERGRRLGTLKELPRQIQASGVKFDPETVTVKEVLQSAEKWWGGIGEETREEWANWIGQDAPGRLGYMLDRWTEAHSEEIEHEEPLAVEMYWERQVPGPAGIALFGFIDEVFYHRKRQAVVIRDHKTAKSLDTQTSLDDMMDSQLQLYAWGAGPQVREWGRGAIRALSYDRMASVAPKTPVLTMMGSLSKQVTRFDLHTYTEWAKGPDGQGQPYPGRKKDGSGAGLYTAEPEVIERLSSPSERASWFQRTMVPLNMNLVKSHLRAAIDSANDTQRTQARVEQTGEAPRNLTASNCRWCDFVSLCRAQMVGGPDGEYDPEDYGLRRSK